MTYSKPARTAARPPQSTILIALAVVIAAIIAALGYQVLAALSSLPTQDAHARSNPATPATAARQAGDVRRRHLPGHLPPIDVLHSDQPGAPGEADGAVPDGVTLFDDEIPAVANLDPDLLGALRQAATDAAGGGVEFYVTNGWRSPEYLHQLLRDAVSEYGSEEEAAQWVATADTSPRVAGDAIDIGPVEAAAWLFEHGVKYGLCQIYSNEPWHYELRPGAIDHGCPAMYADPTRDPGRQQ